MCNLPERERIVPRFDGVILDLDGTLIDSNDAHAWSWVEAFTLLMGGPAIRFEEVRPLIGRGADQIFDILLDLDPDSPKAKRLNDWRKDRFKAHYLPALKAFPHSRDLLVRMRHAGLRLVVGTSSEGELLDRLLELAGAKGLVESAATASDAARSKPHPDIVESALAKLRLPPERVAMLGDTPYDIQAARRAGVATIALRCGGWSDKDLAGALAIYDDPADLLARFESSPLAEGHPVLTPVGP